MDQIDLPVVEPNATLAQAIELMKTADRSAVFVTHATQPRVVDVDMILHAIRSKRNLRIGEVEPRAVTITLERSLSALMSDGTFAAMGAGPTQARVRGLMDDARAVYALADISGGRAVIFTRHEGFRDMLNYAQMWRCQLDSSHVWATADLLQPGNKCINDQGDTDLI